MEFFDSFYEGEKGRDVTSKTSTKSFLAFGASLTEGFYYSGFRFHPYTEKLEELLARDGHTLNLVNRGVSGETTWEMINRLESIINQPTKFDFVCILAGSNDLGTPSETASSIFKRLLTLYAMVLNSGAKLIVVALSQASFDREDENYLRRKLEVNERIHQFYEEKKSTKQVEYVDLYSSIPYYGEDGKKSHLWDDHLHFNPNGYDAFGELVYEKLRVLL
jgi:lysophospholipase L1-like esterase